MRREWYQKKTVWAAVAAILSLAATQITDDPAVQKWCLFGAAVCGILEGAFVAARVERHGLVILLACAGLVGLTGCGWVPTDRQIDRGVDTVQGVMSVANPFMFVICVADITTRTFWPGTRELTPAQAAAVKAAAEEKIKARNEPMAVPVIPLSAEDRAFLDAEAAKMEVLP